MAIFSCLVLHGVEIDSDPKSVDEITLEVFRASKTIFEAKTSEVFTSGNEVWIPRKTGPPVTVSLSG